MNKPAKPHQLTASNHPFRDDFLTHHDTIGDALNLDWEAVDHLLHGDDGVLRGCLYALSHRDYPGARHSVLSVAENRLRLMVRQLVAANPQQVMALLLDECLVISIHRERLPLLVAMLPVAAVYPAIGHAVAMAHIGHEHPEIRAAAIELLAASPGPGIAAALEQSLSDPAVVVQAATVRAVHRYPQYRLVTMGPLLADLLDGQVCDHYPALGSSIRELLAALNYSLPRSNLLHRQFAQLFRTD